MVTAPNSRRGRINTGLVEGEGVIFYKIPRMHLTPGTYHLTAGVYDENNLHVFDQREREFELRVQPGNANDAEGFIDMGGNWTMPGRGDAEDDEMEGIEQGAPISASEILADRVDNDDQAAAETLAEHDGAA